MRKILVWDAPTRLFHWLLAFSFAGAYLRRRGGSSLHASCFMKQACSGSAGSNRTRCCGSIRSNSRHPCPGHSTRAGNLIRPSRTSSRRLALPRIPHCRAMTAISLPAFMPTVAACHRSGSMTMPCRDAATRRQASACCCPLLVASANWFMSCPRTPFIQPHLDRCLNGMVVRHTARMTISIIRIIYIVPWNKAAIGAMLAVIHAKEGKREAKDAYECPHAGYSNRVMIRRRVMMPSEVSNWLTNSDGPGAMDEGR